MEVWKDIPGYEGKYQASSYGQIRSLDREVIVTERVRGRFKRVCKGKILAQKRQDAYGHLGTSLGQSGQFYTHYLVALTFLGERPENQDVRHLDGNLINNNLENLAYGSRTDNIIDCYRQGKAWRKLTLEQAREIKIRLAKGETGTSLAKEFGVNHTSIYRIKNGKTFSWMGEIA
ncbi:NUMOD4 domain-containing protein [Lactococcus lactis]|uniref:NUMOD4 domain-containing protein n=1 Tax=Lactococcus lactis TaxID=1358 RepID=A0AAP3Z0Z3_9LACT|nr:NUMOD4 domain-containing protein [Lactococcus lactis]MDG4968269.1 NUMOD4 domain-containing protein [Lactococcus lactis]MDG4976371.1 NUMOD4 domain-containing protein [Lactococcus lactis]MDG5102175.1 NUMOD4 domain-containing protein [Lactococcus lactis]